MTVNTSVDPQQTKLLKEYKLDRPLTACHWDPRSRFIFCGAEDNFVHRVDPASGQMISLAAHDSWIRAETAFTLAIIYQQSTLQGTNNT